MVESIEGGRVAWKPGDMAIVEYPGSWLDGQRVHLVRRTFVKACGPSGSGVAAEVPHWEVAQDCRPVAWKSRVPEVTLRAIPAATHAARGAVAWKPGDPATVDNPEDYYHGRVVTIDRRNPFFVEAWDCAVPEPASGEGTCRAYTESELRPIPPTDCHRPPGEPAMTPLAREMVEGLEEFLESARRGTVDRDFQVTDVGVVRSSLPSSWAADNVARLEAANAIRLDRVAARLRAIADACLTRSAAQIGDAVDEVSRVLLPPDHTSHRYDPPWSRGIVGEAAGRDIMDAENSRHGSRPVAAGNPTDTPTSASARQTVHAGSGASHGNPAGDRGGDGVAGRLGGFSGASSAPDGPVGIMLDGPLPGLDPGAVSRPVGSIIVGSGGPSYGRIDYAGTLVESGVSRVDAVRFDDREKGEPGLVVLGAPGPAFSAPHGSDYRAIDGGPVELPVVLDPGARMPERKTSGSAGLDLFPLHGASVVIHGHSSARVPTGVHVQIPPGFMGKIEGRSSLAAQMIAPAGGIIDSDFRGQIEVVLVNHGPGYQMIEPGKAIAQLVILPCALMPPVVVGALGATGRGAGGFGSTDGRDGKAGGTS